MKNLLLLPVCVLFFANLSLAVNCGDTVSGNVTLNADLVCNSQHGLTVGAGNTTINLNGHTITCVGSGVAGSCQPSTGQPLVGIFGIRSMNVDGTKILGPGTITGFENGILLQQGAGFVVKDVDITGPQLTLATNNRRGGRGIFLVNVPWPISILGKTPGALITQNEISNQVVGIAMNTVACAEIHGNVVHDINAQSGGSYAINGMKLTSSRIYRNTLTHNGLNGYWDRTLLIHGASTNNEVFNNYVSVNCASGIQLSEEADFNKIYGNTARLNGSSNMDGKCAAPPAPFYDLMGAAQQLSNVWSANNVCKTQTGAIPAGVCNANE